MKWKKNHTCDSILKNSWKKYDFDEPKTEKKELVMKMRIFELLGELERENLCLRNSKKIRNNRTWEDHYRKQRKFRQKLGKH